MADSGMIEADSYRIAGMGMGTFAIFLSAIICLLIWMLTSPLDNCVKWFWRFWSTVSFAIVFILLLYADREPRYIYPNQENEIKVNYFVNIN